jgi:two-component system sensor histidine kinase AlgZ
MSRPAPAPEPDVRSDERDFFLPDFCEARAVLAIVLIAALTGLALALARQSGGEPFWFELARMSAFLLWAGLLSAAVLCRARPWLARQPARAAIGWTLLLLAGTVAALSEAVFRLGQYWTIQAGTPSTLLPASHWRFVLPNALLAVLIGGVMLRYFYVAHQWRRSVELEARARVHALQARIRPHFLFNSMNTIASLTRTHPAQAEAAIEDLSDLFRVSLGEARSHLAFATEVEVARTYERIEQLRLGDRLQVRWDVDPVPAHTMVPALLLQPLLENAIGHGVERLPGGGAVDVRGRVDGASIVLEVSNPRPADTAPPQRKGHQMALDNIRQRLELAFPGRSSVDIDETAARYTVRLRFPRDSEDRVTGDGGTDPS